MTQQQPPLVKISELARLSGVPSPTIKHYMREGLLPGPARRTSRNMAYYDARLADRVRAIKDLQQGHFLPLKLIGEVLQPGFSPDLREDLDEATRARLRGIGPAIEDGIEVSRRRRGGEGTRARRTRPEILESLKIDGGELDLLAELGLSRATVPARGEPYYAGPDLDIIEVIHETRERGMGDLFPMSILEPYVAAVRSLVRMELELFRRRVLSGATLPALPLPEVTRDATDLGERLICAMRNKLVIPELTKLTSSPAEPASNGRKRAHAVVPSVRGGGAKKTARAKPTRRRK